MKIKVTKIFKGLEENRDFLIGEVLTTSSDCTEERMKLFIEKEVAEAVEEAEKPKRKTTTRKKTTKE